ncbi:response regulator transcription factor [Sporosalibacterium faouarense]|uniref:response regulator transcription factor n=1 Tax=Sporosalibacterium faouarense TaxID=516123 RepID=UPI00192ADDB4|nr:response regulator transcription factor [Sporosalibacterium faouarense]
MNKKTILIIENDVTTRRMVQLILEEHRFHTIAIEDGEKTFDILNKGYIDAIILDLYLPDSNGFEIIRTIREHNLYYSIPIIMLTSNTDKMDAVLALELGADDYITRPFYKRELVARLNASLRRVRVNHRNKRDVVEFDDFKLNLKNRKLRKNVEDIHLTYGEFEILSLLASNPEMVFSRDDMLNRLWGENYTTETRVIDMHISSIRKKISSSKNKWIETVRGVGYRFKSC